jgi:RNA polymerase primary sigma factor
LGQSLKEEGDALDGFETPDYAEENRQLFSRLKETEHPGTRADIRNELARLNQNMVYSVASVWFEWRHKRPPYPEDPNFLDLMGAGNMGLTKAIDGFDLDRGRNFSTYALPKIIQAIRLEYYNDSPIRINPDQRRTLLALHHIKKVLAEQFQLSTVSDELAAKAYIATILLLERKPLVEEVRNISFASDILTWPLPASQQRRFLLLLTLQESDRKSASCRSLDAPVKRGEEGEGDTLASLHAGDTPTPAAAVAMTETAQKQQAYLQQALRHLPKKRDLQVLTLRHGLLGRSFTLEEIGALFKVTRERIRQVEDKAFQTLKTLAAQAATLADRPPGHEIRPPEKEPLWAMIQQAGLGCLSSNEEKALLLFIGMDLPLEQICRLGPVGWTGEPVLTEAMLKQHLWLVVHKLIQHQEDNVEPTDSVESTELPPRFLEQMAALLEIDPATPPSLSLPTQFFALDGTGKAKTGESDAPCEPKQKIEPQKHVPLPAIVITPADAQPKPQDALPRTPRKPSTRAASNQATLHAMAGKRASRKRSTAPTARALPEEATLIFKENCSPELQAALRQLPLEQRLVLGFCKGLYQDQPTDTDVIAPLLGMSRPTLYRVRGKALAALAATGYTLEEQTPSRKNDIEKALEVLDPAEKVKIKTVLPLALSRLTDLDREVISARLGFHNDNPPQSLTEVASQHGKSLEWVRSVQKRALTVMEPQHPELCQTLRFLFCRNETAPRRYNEG